MTGEKRAAIITGGGRGIGLAIGQRLLRDGWHALLADRELPSGLADGLPCECTTIEQDIALPGAAERIVEAAMERFGRLDCLVNNAGIGNASPVDRAEDEELQRFLDVNLTAAFRMARAAIRVMGEGASIVNIASVLALQGTPSTAAYAATKAAIAGLTRQMAVEYGPRGIRINAVAPGLIETALTETRLENDAAFRRIWREGTPWPRLGRPEDVAAAVRFLVSEDAAFINGHILVVDGGWSAGRPG